MFGRGGDSSSSAAAPPTEASAEAEVPAATEPELTATETATESAGAVVESAPEADPSSLLRPDAPRNYTVKRGDTLWDIATLFLKDPWLWPEVWIINPQVQNPHLIYPGDTLALAFGANGTPQIRLQNGGAARLNPRLRSSPLDGAIPTLPYASIAAFLSRPSLLTREQLKDAPQVLAFREQHLVGGSNNEIYVNNLNAPQNARFSVVHVAGPLRDPDNGDLLGYEGVYTATASVLTTTNPQKAVLSDSARETLTGDVLLAAEESTPLNFVLSAPPENFEGRIISVVDGTELIGQYRVVAINRGKRHGVVPGNIMSIDQAGAVVRDRNSRAGTRSRLGFAPKVRLPDERAGTLLVFRTFDRMSYGLVVGASTTIRVADYVRTP